MPRTVIRIDVLSLVVVALCASHVHARQGGVPGPASPPAAPAGANMWNWSALGPLAYDSTYTGTLRLANDCKVPATFIVTPEVPGMSSGGNVTVLPGASMDVAMTLKTPNRSAAPTEIDRSDPANPVRRWRTELRGRIRVAYAGYEDEEYVCYGRTGVTLVVARFEHAELEPSKEKIARPDDCTVWWNTGRRPPNNPSISEEQCVDRIRKLAAEYRERALDPLVQKDPQKWAWLPSVAQIQSMSVAELLAMKERAAEQLKKEDT
jgi:hypothetical protein